MKHLLIYNTESEYRANQSVPLDSVSLIESTKEVKFGSPLLSLYDKLDYIQSIPNSIYNGAYINTGVVPTMNTRVEAHIVEIGTDTVVCGGWKDSYNANAFGFNNDPEVMYAAFLNSYVGDLPHLSDSDHVVILDAEKVVVDGTKVHDFPQQSGPFDENMNPICFFAALRGSDAFFFTNAGSPETYKLKISNFKIYEGNTILKDFYPVKRKSDSVIGVSGR